jgi:hypothetical protein
MREGPNTSGSQAQARGLGAGAIASLTGVGLLLIFMFQNTESVRLDFLFWGFTWPLWFADASFRVPRGVGLVRGRCHAPSPTPQGAPPGQTRLTRAAALIRLWWVPLALASTPMAVRLAQDLELVSQVRRPSCSRVRSTSRCWHGANTQEFSKARRPRRMMMRSKERMPTGEPATSGVVTAGMLVR